MWRHVVLLIHGGSTATQEQGEIFVQEETRNVEGSPGSVSRANGITNEINNLVRLLALLEIALASTASKAERIAGRRRKRKVRWSNQSKNKTESPREKKNSSLSPG